MTRINVQQQNCNSRKVQDLIHIHKFTALFQLVMILILPWTIHSSVVSGEPENSWIAIARDENAAVEERTEALDSLVIRFDPLLYEFFKDIAFRSQSREVALTALDYISSFAQTYRWLEACDTLTAVMRSYPDDAFRAAALQANKIAYYAIIYGAPFDRNHMVDVLMEMVAPDTHISDARAFYSAVWLLSNVADNSQLHAIAALEYVRDNYEDYELTDAIIATDALQIFKSNINQEYFDIIAAFDPPPLIDTLPANASTPDYITAAGFMLDSAATDSLGFSALEWLKENGTEVHGDEGIRLLYLNSVAAYKRPDIAADVKIKLQEILPRFGLSARKPFVHRNALFIQKPVATFRGNYVLIDRLSDADHVCVLTLQGKVLYSQSASGSHMRIPFGHPGNVASCIVLINGQPVVSRIGQR